MKKKRKLEKVNLKDGFTIIEVVLVLAIAGLIFLMVFIALPALQRSQRDTQRRDDVARVQQALTQFMTNNRNRVPGFTGAPATLGTSTVLWGSCELDSDDPADPKNFCGAYLLVGDDSFEDPDGTPYQFKPKSETANGDGGSEGGGETETGSVPSSQNSLLSVLAAPDATRAFTPVGPLVLSFAENDHTIWVTYNAKCDGESTVGSTGYRKVALQYKLEGGGVVCVNN
jgi:prepilin-type N-terminal cleavage/methylation domain-containing protein